MPLYLHRPSMIFDPLWVTALGRGQPVKEQAKYSLAQQEAMEEPDDLD
jgi:hypothetical protein